jgi:hypothetical protein
VSSAERDGSDGNEPATVVDVVVYCVDAARSAAIGSPIDLRPGRRADVDTTLPLRREKSCVVAPRCL